MSFTSCASRTYTPVGRKPLQLSHERAVPDCMISKPQKVAHCPSMLNVSTLDAPPSIVARSPGYCRTTIGAAAVPASVEVKVPAYVPPRSQIVSPGRTEPWPPFSAVCRSHGEREPSPPVVPVGAANHPATTIAAAPAVPPYVATTVVCPGWFAVTRAVCGPVGTTAATAGACVPQATCAATGLPPASRIVAANEIVSPTSSVRDDGVTVTVKLDRKSTRLNSSHITISYAVFCLKKKKKTKKT